MTDKHDTDPLLQRVGMWLELMEMPTDEWGHEEAMIYSMNRIAIAEALKSVLTMTSQNGYTTWDKSMVPLVGGKYDEEAAKEWEVEHGHDIRLKCYPEFGCQLWIDPVEMRERIEKALGVEG